MTSIACQVMDAITAALQGTPGVVTLITDSARVVEETDGMTITVDMDGAATDRIGKTCLFRKSVFRCWRNGTCPSVPQNTMPMVKLHSPGDSPGRRSSFHP